VGREVLARRGEVRFVVGKSRKIWRMIGTISIGGRWITTTPLSHQGSLAARRDADLDAELAWLAAASAGGGEVVVVLGHRHGETPPARRQRKRPRRGARLSTLPSSPC
jgi:hypothetical protein